MGLEAFSEKIYGTEKGFTLDQYTNETQIVHGF
jgi:hypothetical protein